MVQFSVLVSSIGILSAVVAVAVLFLKFLLAFILLSIFLVSLPTTILEVFCLLLLLQSFRRNSHLVIRIALISPVIFNINEIINKWINIP